MSIEIQNVRKKFGNFAAVDDVSLTIQRGELVALLGPSGSGKTSLLRIIAGLQLPDEGRVLFDGEDLALRRVRERRVGFVFQHYALFRHMTVFENVAFGLRVMPRSTRPSREEIRTRVTDLLKLVQIEWLANQYPAQLSGGQRQRVALARALIVQPRVLLLDEPFGALDAKVRRELRRWLRNLHNEIQVTSVFVTHDQEEALEVADRVVIMNRGRIVQSGTPEEVYDHPDSPFVFEFLGNVNLFHSRVHQGAAEIHGVRVDAPELREIQDATGTAYVRPQDFDVSRSPGKDASIEAIVRHISRAGSLVRLELQRADSADPIEAELTRDQFLQLGAQKGERLFLSPRRVRVFTDSLTSAQL